MNTKRCKELLLFSLQSRIANAASEQMIKRNKLDVFKVFAIKHSFHSSQPKSTCGSNMAIILYTTGITEHLVLKIVTAEQSQSY